MKKILKLISVFMLVLSLVYVGNFKADYTKSVTFVDKGATTKEVNYTFNGDTEIGLQNASARRGYSLFVEYFMFWSTSEDINDANAKIAFETDKISTVFPQGIPDGAKLYAHYVGSAEIMGALGGGSNKVSINKMDTAKVVLPESIILTNNGFEDESVASKDATVLFDPNQDTIPVRIRSSFDMNTLLSVLTYRNPDMRIAGAKDAANTVADSTAEVADYVNVDLKVEISEDVTVKDKMSVSFKSYNFFPWFVMDENNQKLQIFDENDAPLENLGEVTSNTNPFTTFKVQTNGARKFTIRTRLRSNSNNNKKIAGVTAEQLKEPMELYSTDVDAFVITKEKALENANQSEFIPITGKIKGTTYINHRLFAGQPIEIPETSAVQSLRIKFEKRGNIVVKFEDTTGMELKAPVTLVENGVIGENYDANNEKVATFELDGKTYHFKLVKEDNATGNIAEGTTYVTFVYEKEVTSVPNQNIPTVDLPTAEIGVTPNNPPVVDLPVAEIKLVPNTPEKVVETKPNPKNPVETSDSTPMLMMLVVASFFAIRRLVTKK